jgi:hypothetical protein
MYRTMSTLVVYAYAYIFAASFEMETVSLEMETSSVLFTASFHLEIEKENTQYEV